MSQSTIPPNPVDVSPEIGEKSVAAGGALRELTADEYPRWDALVDASPQSSVFCRTWWLKTTCDEIRILGLFSNSHLVAGIPLYFKKHYGIRACRMPPLTQTLGVVMEPLSGKRSSIANRETEILAAFASALAKQYIFLQTFHPTLQNWLPFYWQGFRQTSRFSYVVDDLRDPKKIWEDVGHRPRSEIRKAEHQGLAVTPCGVDTLVELESKTFARQNLPLPHSPAFLQRIYAAAKENNAGECFAVRDQGGTPHCSGFVVWDRSRTYYLVSGGDPDLRTSGATSLLAWHLIRFSAERSKVFDFEGSMLQPVERLFRNFGATRVSYNLIVKIPLWLHTYLRWKGTF
jgi:hypothetical protein